MFCKHILHMAWLAIGMAIFWFCISLLSKNYDPMQWILLGRIVMVVLTVIWFYITLHSMASEEN